MQRISRNLNQILAEGSDVSFKGKQTPKAKARTDQTLILYSVESNFRKFITVSTAGMMTALHKQASSLLLWLQQQL